MDLSDDIEEVEDDVQVDRKRRRWNRPANIRKSIQVIDDDIEDSDSGIAQNTHGNAPVPRSERNDPNPRVTINQSSEERRSPNDEGSEQEDDEVREARRIAKGKGRATEVEGDDEQDVNVNPESDEMNDFVASITAVASTVDPRDREEAEERALVAATIVDLTGVDDELLDWGEPQLGQQDKETQGVKQEDEATQDVESIAEINPSSRDLLAKSFLRALSMDITSLVDTLLVEERSISNFNRRHTHYFIVETTTIFASMDKRLIEEIIAGNLALARRRDPHIRAILEANRQRSNTQPAIYQQMLVNERGYSPTPDELTRMLDYMRDYCDSRKTPPMLKDAVRIDKAFNQKSHWGQDRVVNGELKYLYHSKPQDPNLPDYGPSDHRIKNILTFRDNLLERLEPLRGTPFWREPLQVPLIEIGYAAQPLHRLKQHKDHVSSNYIMNLMEAICSAFFKAEYRIEGFIIFHIFAPIQAVIGEIMFTHLGQGYINRGGGFSHYCAGRSNHSVLHVDELHWLQFKQRVFPHLEKEMGREAAKSKAITSLLLEEDRLEVECVDLAVEQSAFNTVKGDLDKGRARLEDRRKERISNFAELIAYTRMLNDMKKEMALYEVLQRCLKYPDADDVEQS